MDAFYWLRVNRMRLLSLQLYSGHGIKVKIIMTKYFPLGCKGPTDCDPESTGGSRFGFLGSIIN